MPEMDGLEFAKSIRKDRRSIPIILLSPISDERCTQNPGIFSSIPYEACKNNGHFTGIY
jgi:CheY-like chemotaxis protein